MNKYLHSPAVTHPAEMTELQIDILTSGGIRIPVQATVLSSASPVLASIINREEKQWSSERSIRMVGVPCDAVTLFVQFLCSKNCSEEEMDKYAIHLLALSHVYMVPQLKQRCTKTLAEHLEVENVVDVLQMARLCDAPDLYLRCMKKIAYSNFKAFECTEGWKFVQKHDPWLELEILQFIDEAESRKKRNKQHREEQSLYVLLSEAMECLEHICTEGCTSIRPYDMESSKRKVPCTKFSTCQGLQFSIYHFASCNRRVNGGCLRCKRVWQILRLHSSICHKSDTCKVPLCSEFKLKSGKEKKGGRWKLLVKKVASAKVLSSLSMPTRKWEEEPLETKLNRRIESLGYQKIDNPSF